MLNKRKASVPLNMTKVFININVQDHPQIRGKSAGLSNLFCQKMSNTKRKWMTRKQWLFFGSWITHVTCVPEYLTFIVLFPPVQFGAWTSVTTTLEFGHKDWLLSLENLQTFYQSGVYTRQKDKMTKWQNDKMTKKTNESKNQLLISRKYLR